MARARYIPGALVEARNSKYGKGFGIILTGPTMDTKAATRYRDLINPQQWFTVQWFKKPGNISSWAFHNNSAQVDMTKNQIKLVRT
jgi:hypothetical protein